MTGALNSSGWQAPVEHVQSAPVSGAAPGESKPSAGRALTMTGALNSVSSDWQATLSMFSGLHLCLAGLQLQQANRSRWWPAGWELTMSGCSGSLISSALHVSAVSAVISFALWLL